MRYPGMVVWRSKGGSLEDACRMNIFCARNRSARGGGGSGRRKEWRGGDGPQGMLPAPGGMMLCNFSEAAGGARRTPND